MWFTDLMRTEFDLISYHYGNATDPGLQATQSKLNIIDHCARLFTVIVPWLLTNTRRSWTVFHVFLMHSASQALILTTPWHAHSVTGELDLDPWPTTLTYNPRLARVEVDPHAKKSRSTIKRESTRKQTIKQMDRRYQMYYLLASQSIINLKLTWRIGLQCIRLCCFKLSFRWNSFPQSSHWWVPDNGVPLKDGMSHKMCFLYEIKLITTNLFNEDGCGKMIVSQWILLPVLSSALLYMACQIVFSGERFMTVITLIFWVTVAPRNGMYILINAVHKGLIEF